MGKLFVQWVFPGEKEKSKPEIKMEIEVFFRKYTASFVAAIPTEPSGGIIKGSIF